MRTLDVARVTETVARLCLVACCELGRDVTEALVRARESESSPLGAEMLAMILDNLELARREGLPVCQDTGMAVVFLELGQDLHLAGGDLTVAVNEGVRRGYTDGYLRKSVLSPLGRVNSGDNTPAVIHVAIVPGEGLRIVVAPKGAGSENMGGLRMLKPADGREGIKEFVLETVRKAGANPCPPIILGVGIGGTMEKSALLAKRALLREVGAPHPDPETAVLERELLAAVNATGIGPQGLGGSNTALAVHVETYPTHIAQLPVAVNIQCHVARHAEAVL